ncbi:hypothetical protein EDEG_00347 [Edhazardia aedis USNM 41457]|uniref:Uncharacterized protein n=1 Tax=Edhazardia aedis (strain USNM 41457) TaxID=1003232 RepID=J8ZQ51_EDHAE|nr:hypothetical protein EDEG_00347 [Edhazardia aedis USNM 41457]|eukprot:EJW01823.1 hypothetical protein EDEG_00347 [Edhazardia aedis USNM 41457]
MKILLSYKTKKKKQFNIYIEIYFFMKISFYEEFRAYSEKEMNTARQYVSEEKQKKTDKIPFIKHILLFKTQRIEINVYYRHLIFLKNPSSLQHRVYRQYSLQILL